MARGSCTFNHSCIILKKYIIIVLNYYYNSSVYQDIPASILGYLIVVIMGLLLMLVMKVYLEVQTHPSVLW